MGMTIDEHMKQLKKLKSFHNGSYGASINFALDTMRKYQKIKQILDNWENNGEEDDPINIIDNIEEVIEDGKMD